MEGIAVGQGGEARLVGVGRQVHARIQHGQVQLVESQDQKLAKIFAEAVSFAPVLFILMIAGSGSASQSISVRSSTEARSARSFVYLSNST